MALTNEQLRAFIPRTNFLMDKSYSPTVEEDETEVTTSYGIPNTNAFIEGKGGNNNVGPFTPYTAQPSGSFVTNRTSYGSSGYLPGTEPEDTFMDTVGGLIRKGIGFAIPGGNFLMGMADNFSRENRLNAQDNAFIDMQLANQEQNIHGFGNLTTQDRYGYNKDSLTGNYANVVADRVAIANQRLKDNKELRPIDQYYLEKQKEEDDVKNQIDFNDFVRQRITANNIRDRIKNDPTYNENFNIHNDGDGGNTITPPNITPFHPSQGNNGGGHVHSPGTYDTDTSTGGSGDHRTSSKSDFTSKDDAREQYGKWKDGGRIGFFAHGGRVYLNLGGLATLL